MDISTTGEGQNIDLAQRIEAMQAMIDKAYERLEKAAVIIGVVPGAQASPSSEQNR